MIMHLNHNPRKSRMLGTWILVIAILTASSPILIHSRAFGSDSSTKEQNNSKERENDIAKVDSLSQLMERLIVELNAEIKISNARIDALKEASDRTYFIFIVLGAIGSAIGGVLAFQQIQQRRELHGKVLRIYETQAQIAEGYQGHQGTLLDSQESHSRSISAITTSFSEILSDIKEVLGFRVEESKLAVEAMQQQAKAVKRLPQILKVLQDLKKERQDQIDSLLTEANRLVQQRNVYASPNPYLKSQFADFRTKMDLIPIETLQKYTGIKSESKQWRYGEIFLRRGIIAYYDNDPTKAQEVLSLAEQFFPFSKELLSSMSDNQKYATAFTMFYLALIEKNYGNMRKAKSYIEMSYEVWGKKENTELLTPVTYAEILSYSSTDTDIEEARKIIEEVIKRAKELLKIKPELEPHEKNYFHRAYLMIS